MNDGKMSHLTRRSLLSLFALGAAQTSAKAREATENQEVSPEEILKKIPTHWIAIGKLTSAAGLAFEREFFKEVLLEVYSAERVGEEKSRQAPSKIPKEIGFFRTILISQILEIDRSETDFFRRPATTKFSKEEWAHLANEMSLEDAAHLQTIVFKLQFDRAADAIGKSKHALDIGKIRQEHGESLMGVKKALGLYVDPKGIYGLGGSDEDQWNARQVVYAARNLRQLSKDEMDKMIAKVPWAYLPSIEEAIKHYDQLCGYLHIKNLNSRPILNALDAAGKNLNRSSNNFDITQNANPAAHKPALHILPQR